MRASTKAAIVLAVVVAVGAGLRLYHLTRTSLWYDEAYSLAEASDRAGLWTGTNVGSDAPLYLWILHAAGQLTRAEAPLRATSALFGTLTLVGIYAIGRRLLDPRTALVATGLAAVSPFLIYYSQELRAYSLVALLTCGAIGSLYRATDGGGWRGWSAYALFAVLGLYTHYFGFFALAAAGVYVLFFAGGRQAWLPFALASAGALAAYAPWAPVFLERFSHVGDHYNVPTFRARLIPLVLKTFAVGHHRIPLWLWASGTAAFAGLIALGLARWRHRPRGTALLACYGLVPPLLALLYAALGSNIFMHRYMIGSAVALLILAAAGLARAPRPVAWSAGGVLAAGITVSLVALYQNGPMQELMIFPKKPFRQMVHHVDKDWADNAGSRANTLVVHFDRSSFLPFCLYSDPTGRQRQLLLARGDRHPEPFLPSYPDASVEPVPIGTIETRLKSAEGLWLVLSSWTDDASDPTNQSFDQAGRERAKKLIQKLQLRECRERRWSAPDFPQTSIRYYEKTPPNHSPQPTD